MLCTKCKRDNPLDAQFCQGCEASTEKTIAREMQSAPAVSSASLLERRGFELPVLFALRIFREGS